MSNLTTKRKIQALILVLVAAGSAYGYATGPNQGYTGAPGDYGDCTACHDTYAVANVGAGSVALGQIPDVYKPGQSYMLQVMLQDPQARRWGFELTALGGDGNRAGTFAPLGSDTQIASVGDPVGNRQYIEHTLLGTFPGTKNGHTWQVQWTAPSTDTGAVHLYVAGNAANNDGTDQGDYIYTNGATIESPSTVVNLDLISNPEGMTLQAGTPYEITWSATNASNVQDYELRYSTDNGATFPITNLIFSTTDPTVTSTSWTVPDTPTNMAKLRLLAATNSGAVVTVISGAFTISGGTSTSSPVILSANNAGKKLVVHGQGFQQGAIVQVNGENQVTVNKADFSHKLVCAKGAKTIAPGAEATLTVTNPDGSVSPPLVFTRPPN
jgi:hypothetical protein